MSGYKIWGVTHRSGVGAEASDGTGAKELDDALYEIVTLPRDDFAPQYAHYTQYGDMKQIKRQKWSEPYAALGIDGGFEHEDPATGQSDKKENLEYEIEYAVFEPTNVPPNTKLLTLFMVHGVPVNMMNVAHVARIMGNCVRVVIFSMLGMGESSQPVNFNPTRTSDVRSGDWYWRWANHAVIADHLFRGLAAANPDWQLSGENKGAFIGEDWGAAISQLHLDRFGNNEDNIIGAYGIGSGIQLTGYWVQHIGALRAFAELPYRTKQGKLDPTFYIQGISFGLTYTSLIETMFNRTDKIHDQATMQLLQDTYVRTESYDDPSKSPATTQYRFHNIRVLAQQATVSLGLGQLMPRHSQKNPGGLRISQWRRPLLWYHGRDDKMMRFQQGALWSEMMQQVAEAQGRETSVVEVHQIQDAGHFASSDQPEITAETIVNFLKRHFRPTRFATAVLGYQTKTRRDTSPVLKRFAKLRGQN